MALNLGLIETHYNNMKKLMFCFASLYCIVLFSCGNKEETIRWENGNLKMVKSRIVDSLNYYEENYYDNGKLYAKGLRVNGKKEGKWIFMPNVKDSLGKQISFYHMGLSHGARKIYTKDDNLRSVAVLLKDTLKMGVRYFELANGVLKKEIYGISNDRDYYMGQLYFKDGRIIPDSSYGYEAIITGNNKMKDTLIITPYVNKKVNKLKLVYYNEKTEAEISYCVEDNILPLQLDVIKYIKGENFIYGRLHIYTSDEEHIFPFFVEFPFIP